MPGCNYTFACSPCPIALVMFDLSLRASVSANGDGVEWGADVQHGARQPRIYGAANVTDKLMKTTHPPGTMCSGSLL